jgi:hypothetical protein
MRAEFAAIAAGFALLPQTLTANKAVVINSSGNGMTVTAGSLVLAGDLTLAGAFTTTGFFNTTLIQTASVSLTLPGINDTLVGRTTTDTLTNKTLTAPVMTAPVLGTPASGTLTNCTGLPNAGLVNFSITIGSTNIALGATATTVAGLTLATATFDASLNTLTNITTAMFATNVVDTDPTLAANSNTRIPSQAAVMSFVSNAITGLTWKPAVQAATVTTLPTYVYANGSSGVGATITEVGNGALPTIDGVVLTAGQRILVKNETAGNAPYNGLYSVTQVGSVILPFILTRVTDADTSTKLWGSAVLSEAGTVNANTQWTNSNATAPTIGTTAITFSQISGAGTYSATGGITLTGNQFSITTGGITNAMLTNPSVTIGSTTVALGATAATLAGLTLTSPTISGTVAGAHTYSGALTLSAALTYGGVTLSNAVTGTGNMVLSASPTISGLTVTGSFTPAQVAGIVGTTTNNNATAGAIGEFVTNSATGLNPADGTPTNITSISLTAGDWDVWGTGSESIAGTTNAYAEVSISTTTATRNNAVGAWYGTTEPMNNFAVEMPIAPIRFSLGVTTTIYLVFFASVNNTNTKTVGGILNARRRR